MAQLRSTQPPRTAAELREQSVAQVVPMPAQFRRKPTEGEPHLKHGKPPRW
jgi:hypothetical protein